MDILYLYTIETHAVELFIYVFIRYTLHTSYDLFKIVYNKINIINIKRFRAKNELLIEIK